MMTTARLLESKSQPTDTSVLVARLAGIQKNILAVDAEFLQQHTTAFIGRDYAKYTELTTLLETGDALRKSIVNASDKRFFRLQKIEIDGFNTHIQNKIKAYQADCETLVAEATFNMNNHHRKLIMRLKELRKYKQQDAIVIPDLAAPYDELIAAYQSNIENMQEKCDQFHSSIDENHYDARINLRDVLVKLFYIKQFEKSFLAQGNESDEKFEGVLIGIYKKNLGDLIVKCHATLIKMGIIQSNFVLHMDKKNVIQLTTMLKVLQDVLRNIMCDTDESLNGLHEKLYTLSKLKNDIVVYNMKFYQMERLRRLKSSSYLKLLAMSEMVEAEILKSAKLPDRFVILQAVLSPLKFLIQYYIDGRAYEGMTTDHTPLLLDSRLLQQAIDNTLKVLSECLRLHQFKDVYLINWANQFLQKVHAVKPKAQDVSAATAIVEGEGGFSFAKELKEKELDELIGQLTKSLCPTPKGERRYSFLSMLSAKQPSADENSFLMKMQYLIADKSEVNLRTIVALASASAAHTGFSDDLRGIAKVAGEILEMRGVGEQRRMSPQSSL